MAYVFVTAACADPECVWGGQGSGTPPLENDKFKAKGFLNNTGPDPLENHKATKPAFNHRDDWYPLSPHQLKNFKKMK